MKSSSKHRNPHLATKRTVLSSFGSHPPKQIPSPQDPFLLDGESKLMNQLRNTPITKSSADDLLSANSRSPSQDNKSGRASAVKGLIQPVEQNSKESKKYEYIIKYTEIVEDFIMKIGEKPLHTAIEDFFQNHIPCHKVIFWEEMSSIQQLYSYDLKMFTKHTQSIVGFAFCSRQLIHIPVARLHPSYSPEIDGLIHNPQTTLVLFPLINHMESVVGIVEILLKSTDRNINESARTLISVFQSKFKVFARFIIKDSPIGEIAAQQNRLMELDQFLLDTSSRLTRFLHAKSIEIYKMKQEDGRVFKYTTQKVEVERDTLGIISYVLDRDEFIHVKNIRENSHYNPSIDGIEDCAIMAEPVTDFLNGIITVVVARGCTECAVFSGQDERHLKALASVVATGLSNAEMYTDVLKGGSGQSLASIMIPSLPVQNLRIPNDIFIANMMNGLQKVTNADRIYYFSVDHKKKTLTSEYLGGFKKSIQISTSQGYAGKAATTNKIINIPDTSADKSFDSCIDSATRYVTHSILTVPVIGPGGEVDAVLQLMNRRDMLPFSNSDAESAIVFGTVTICVSQHATLVNAKDEYNKRMESICKTIHIAATTASLDDCIHGVKKEAMNLLKSPLCDVYLVDEAANVIRDTTSASRASSVSDGPFAKILDRREPDSSNDCSVNHEELFNMGFLSVCMAPLLSPQPGSDNPKALGVLACSNGDLSYKDVDESTVLCLADALSLRVQVDHRENQLREGQWKLGIEKYIDITERGKFEVPKRLKVDDSMNANSLSFDCTGFDDDHCLSLIYYVFDAFNLMSSLKISSDTVYGFGRLLMKCHPKPKFHNILHAIDVTQFLFFLMNKSGLIPVFKRHEMLAVVSATLCACVGHNGSNNTYLVSTNSHLSKLFEPSRIVETNSATLMAELVDTAGLDKDLDEEEGAQFYQMAVTLVLSSLPKTIEKTIKKTKEIMKSATVDLSNIEHRRILMELLHAAAARGYTCRPFEVAKKWEEKLSQECYKLGEMELERGLVYSSKENSPDLVKRGKAAQEHISQMIPVLDALTLIIGEAKMCRNAAEDNFKAWANADG